MRSACFVGRISKLFFIFHIFRCSTAEGELLNDYQRPLKLEEDGDVFIIFPPIICHVIDSESPLYDYSAQDLLQRR